MPHFTKTLPESETIYDKWLYVLKHLPTLSERPAALQERVFKRLFEVAEIARFTPEEKGLYEDSLKSYRDLKNVIDTAFDEGKMEGLIEGEAKGKMEGLSEMVLEMFADGLPMARIAKIAKLPLEQVEEIIENHKK